MYHTTNRCLFDLLLVLLLGCLLKASVSLTPISCFYDTISPSYKEHLFFNTIYALQEVYVIHLFYIYQSSIQYPYLIYIQLSQFKLFSKKLVQELNIHTCFMPHISTSKHTSLYIALMTNHAHNLM